jgi:hypothetical protein
VWVGGTFTKSGGIIYGDIDNTHNPGDIENTALSGNGHAVSTADGGGKKRNGTADSEVNLYAARGGGAWSHTPTQPQAAWAILRVIGTKGVSHPFPGGSGTAQGKHPEFPDRIEKYAYKNKNYYARNA